MTQPPSEDDPVVHALDELVRSGQLAPERAQAAYQASREDHPPGPPAAAPQKAAAEPSPPRLDVIAVAVGVALLATTVALSSVYSRQESDLDWSNFGLGILATLGLLGVAAAAYLLVGDDAKKANLVAWPGALGALGAGAMIAVAMDQGDATPYVAGLASAVVSAGGFFLVRRGAFVVAAILALLVPYAKLFDDLFGAEEGPSDNIGMKLAAALLVFAVLITVGGWFLPTRDISGVFVGALTVLGFVSVLAGLAVAAFIQGFTAAISGELPGADQPDADRFHNDVYVILLFTVLLAAGWAACSWLTGHAGYRVLILLLLTTTVPLATGALAVEHPSWWGLGVGIVGAGVLGVAGLRGVGMLANLGRRPPPPPPAGGPPVDLDRAGS